MQSIFVFILFLLIFWKSTSESEYKFCFLCRKQSCVECGKTDKCEVFFPDKLEVTSDSSSFLKKMAKEGLSPNDPSSFSRPELVIVRNVSLELEVDFNRKILHGNAQLTVEKIDDSANAVILDVRELKISEITDTDTKKKLKFDITDTVDDFGSKLTVELPPKTEKTYKLNIKYETSPSASGLQWLTPQQTAGKKHPFMFSQFQAIHARSVLPCQDTPAVKTKYTATIFAPKNLTVLMSAKRVDKKETSNGTYFSFTQDVPIPAYLIAIAVGALESRKLGPRSHVWAEKELVEASAYEFADTERVLKTAEEICGPYVWGTYDLLVLPPSFPFGGMENPCLTFVTPTVLAGDRSLASVVAHEIAHSWTGNLVTNKNFEHFWLNEGFTVFVERRIKARLESIESQDFDALSCVGELQETIDHFGKDNPLTSLVVNLKGVHPDDAFSKVPYEKGQTFLRYLENTVGGPEQFEQFLRKYFDTYKYKSIDTDDFRSFFTKYFSNNSAIKAIDWETWLYKPGMPPVIPSYDTSLAKACDSFKKQWLEWNESGRTIPFTADSIKNLTTEQTIYLLQEIMESPPQSINKLKEIESLFNFNKNNNSEIKFRWLRISLKAHWEEKIQPVLDWVNEVGRMKFVRPLYRDLYEWEQARSKAIENFKANRKYMMHVVAYTVAKDLHLSE